MRTLEIEQTGETWRQVGWFDEDGEEWHPHITGHDYRRKGVDGIWAGNVLFENWETGEEAYFQVSGGGAKEVQVGYQDRIKKTLEQMGRTDIDPRHIEAIMRCEHGTLDHLSVEDFHRIAKQSVADLEACLPTAPDFGELLAESYGL